MEDPLSLESLLLLGAVTAPGAVVQGSIGFGWALVSAPILVHLDPHFVPAPMLMASTLLSVCTGLRDRAAIDARGVAWSVGGRIPGALLGALAVASLSQTGLSAAFAVLVLVAVALSIKAPRLELRRRTLAIAGVLSGLMATTSSIGGPPMALVYQHATGPRIRGTLSAYFVLGGLVSLGALALFGELGGQDARLGLALLPGLCVGFALSNLTRRYFDDGRVRGVVLGFAALSAVALLVRIALD